MLSIAVAFGGVFILAIIGIIVHTNDTPERRARKAAKREAPPGS